MALSNAPVFPQAPFLGLQNIMNADASNKKTVVTGAANGSKVVALMATSTETANARVIQVFITRGTSSYLLTSVNVPLNSGFDGSTPGIDLLNQSNLPGLPFGGAVGVDGAAYLYLQYNDTLQVSSTTTVTAGKEIDIVAIGTNF